jgi:uncharacterized membrane protein YesL
MKKPVLFLRIASGLTFIHAVMHTIGGVFGKIPAGPASVAAEAMKVNQFLAMGNLRSFWDFYRGFEIGIPIFLTAESILMLQMAALAKTDAHRLRPMIATLLVAYAVFAINSYVYFFAGPVIAELLIALCLGLAIATAGRESA